MLTDACRFRSKLGAALLAALLSASVGFGACGGSSNNWKSTAIATSTSVSASTSRSSKTAGEGLSVPRRRLPLPRKPSTLSGRNVSEGNPESGSTPGRGVRLENPVFRRGLVKFAVCLRQNGVEVPAPNTSGSGPVLDTNAIDTNSPEFRIAEAKCRNYVGGAFFHRPSVGGPPGSSRPR